jgi:hypothetical protein
MGATRGHRPVAGRAHASHGVWSRLESWYGDDRRLVAVSARGHGGQATQLLAYGLQQLDARELHLVVPRTAVTPTRARAAFLDATVHVHRAQRAGIGADEPPMTHTEATTFYRRLGDVAPPPEWDSSTWPRWLVELVDWLESRRVERVRTQEAHAWHYRGRQVLHVRRAATDGAHTSIAGNGDHRQGPSRGRREAGAGSGLIAAWAAAAR